MNVLLDKDLMNIQVLTDANVVENENNVEQDFPPLSDCELPSSPFSNRGEIKRTLINADPSGTNQDLQSITLNTTENHPSTLSTNIIIPPRISDRGMYSQVYLKSSMFNEP